MARRIYDNWQRLVEAVLKKQQMLDLFHAPSRTPSISSIASDTSSSSNMDHRLSFDHAVFQPSFMGTLQSDEKFESRKHVEEEIPAYLLNDDVNMIGICGTGGIGKTTMAKRIGEMVKKCKIFDEVIMIVVGQQPDIEKIQTAIAEALGLKLENGVQVRASQISNVLKHLSNALIILDDVWENLILEDVGMPFFRSEKRVKIMFTSQNKDILEAMHVQNVFPVQALSEDEAWSLFKEKAGNKADDLDLQPIAREFVQECKGVPLVLGVLASALKEKDKPFWEEGLLELRSRASSAIPQARDHVYGPLKLSYMWLSNEAKSLFILCCLFKEDSDIFLEDLARYGIGLNIFSGIMSLEEARSRVCELTGILRGHSLLEDGCDPVNMKMHNVVRDLAFSIASEANCDIFGMENHDVRLINWDENAKNKNMSLISTKQIELSEELVCPNLFFLWLQSSTNPLVFLEDFFGGMTKLNVCVISGACVETLPPSLHLRTQLRTLHLHSCSVKNLSEIGQLLNLEILSCYDCPRIEVLPAEIGRLNRLRLFELYQCQNLKTIAPGVISSLILLEELKMRGSFAQWQSSGETNAALTELHSLSHLVCLEIEVEDAEVITTWIDPFPNVTKFDIKIGAKVKTELQHPCKMIENQQRMQLSLPDAIVPAYWFHSLLRKTEDLSLMGNGSINLVSEELEKVKKFRCSHCSTMSFLVDSSYRGAFCFLESLDLEGLTNLQDVCLGPIPVGSFLNLRNIKLYEMPSLLHLWINPDPYSSLANLRSIDIRNCRLLPHLFTMSTVGSFDQLEELRILFCGRMKEILLNYLHNTTVSIAFPRLKKIILNSLPSLGVFCQGITSMNFPLLHFLSIRNAPKLKGLLPANGSSHVFFNQGVEFDSLKELSLHGLDDSISQIWSVRIPTDHFFALEKLHIGACNKLKNLFSPLIARALVSLKELHITDSLMLFEVIMNVDQETGTTLFPSLERIQLWRLRSLRSFCQWKHGIELPSLRHLSICMCPEMQTFSLGYLSTPKLECFQVENQQLIEIDDLNEALRRRFSSKLALKSSAAGRR